MKINYSFIARVLIGLLFVFAGVQKLIGFEGTSGYLGSLLGISSPALASIVTAIVIFIEIPVALAFVWGYRLCTTGMILAGFTFIAIVLAHNPWAASIVTPEAMKGAMMAALKNLAIIGGILSAMTMCDCGKCPMGKGGKKCEKCA